MTVPDIALNDGTTIPQLGFGVFQVKPDETAEVVTAALEVGYRHLDTAQMYRNESGVGDAVAKSGLDRDDLYVTTKLNNGFHRPDDARRSFEESLDRLRLDRVDLFLIHWPLPTRYDGDFVSTWRTLVELRDSGRVTSIGVSNFQPDHLDRIIEETGVVPAVNQVEIHPYFTNETVRAANARHGIATESWSPIAQGKVLGDPVIVEIAAAPRAHGVAGHPALAPPARRHRLPQDDPARADARELRDPRLRADRRRPRGDLGPRPGRAGTHRPAPRPDGLDPGLTTSSPGGRPSTRRARRVRLVAWPPPRCPRRPSSSSGPRVT